MRKKIAIEMRKAELRAKMEEASKARRAKKGFMTPERKKKLRVRIWDSFIQILVKYLPITIWS